MPWGVALRGVLSSPSVLFLPIPLQPRVTLGIQTSLGWGVLLLWFLDLFSRVLLFLSHIRGW